MAGLVAAAEARRLGADPLVLEKLPRPGGSMRLSSGVIWRHRDFERFRARVPGRRRARFSGSVRAPRRATSLARVARRAGASQRETGNPLTTGVRFDPEGLTAALVEAAGGVRLGEPARAMPGRRAADPRHRRLRAPAASCCASTSRRRPTTRCCARRPGSTGDGLRHRARGRRPHECRARRGVRPRDARPARAHRRARPRRGSSQLYARHATVTNERGERHETTTWSEIDVAQWQLRQPRARAWFTVPRRAAGGARARADRGRDDRGRRGGGRARPARR